VTPEEVRNLQGKGNPVLCKDGKLGQLIYYPLDDVNCGVQVPGEKEARSIPVSELYVDKLGGLCQVGSPKHPPFECANDGAQYLLAMSWFGLAVGREVNLVDLISNVEDAHY
jgi:hypothetical protein